MLSICKYVLHICTSMCGVDMAPLKNMALAAFLRVINMGWLRLVGSLQLQVSFAKEPYKIGDILQKRPIILRSLLNVTTPYL